MDHSTLPFTALPVCERISAAFLVHASGPGLAFQGGMENEVIGIPPGRTLTGFALEAGCEDGLGIESLEQGTTLIVQTQNSRYRLVVLDGPSHCVLVEGGSKFPQAVPAVLQGARANGSLVKTGWIGVGLRMQLFADPQWVITSRVRSVAVDTFPPRLPGLHNHH